MTQKKKKSTLQKSSTTSNAQEISIKGRIAWESDSNWLFMPPEWCKRYLGELPNFSWLLLSCSEYTFLCRPLPLLPCPEPTLIPSKCYYPHAHTGSGVEDLKWDMSEERTFQVRVVEKLPLCGKLEVQLDDYAWTEEDWVMLNCTFSRMPVRPGLQVTCTGKTLIYKLCVEKTYDADYSEKSDWMLVTKDTKVIIQKKNTAKLSPGLEMLVAGPKGIGKAHFVEEHLKDAPIIPFGKAEDFSEALKLAELASKQTPNQVVLLIKDLDVLAPRDSKEDQLEFVEALLNIPSYITVFGCDTNVANVCPRLKFRTKNLLKAPEDVLSVFRSFWPYHFELSNRVGEFVDQRIKGYLPGDLERVMLDAIAQIDPLLISGKKQPEEDELCNIFKSALAANPPTLLQGYRVQGTDVGMSWDQLGGLFEVKPLLERYVEWPLTRAQEMKAMGLKPPKGILLHGPPGCSKTCIAKAIAAKNAFTFCTLDVADIFSAYVGESEAIIRQVFAQARLAQPAIVFVDEIDALVGRREFGGAGGDVVQERVLTTFLTEMDGVGVEDGERVMVLAATNRLEALDPAIVRPGRFDLVLHVGLPNREERIDILNTYARGAQVSMEIDADEWAADQTEGWSGAELKNLFRASLSTACTKVDIDSVKKGFEVVLRTRNSR